MAQTGRDQVQAHTYMMSRLTAGMLRGDLDTEESPTGRTTRGITIGIAVALLAGVVVALYGLVVGGGATSWRKDGTLVLVKDTGARLLYLNGQLHPVLNDASAKLLAGSQLTVKVVSAKSVAGTALGVAIGISGAPESLPPASALATGAWTACVTGQPGAATGTLPTVSLRVNAAQPPRPLAAGQAVLTAGPDRATYLLWNGMRWKLDTADGAVAALGYDAIQPTPATASVLNVLPAGADLRPPEAPGQGDPGPTFASGQQTRIGQLFTGPSGEHYLLRKDGLVPLTATLFALLRGDPATQRTAYAGQPVTAPPVGPDDLAKLRTPPAAAAALTHDGLLPVTPPTVVPVGSGQVLCVRVTPHESAPVTTVELSDPATVTGPAPAVDPGVTRSCNQADQVVIKAGTGAVVRGLSASGGIDTVQYLVTDVGVRYPMSANGAKQLGYAGTSEVRLPAALLALLPIGPDLDPQDVTGAVAPPANAGQCQS